LTSKIEKDISSEKEKALWNITKNPLFMKKSRKMQTKGIFVNKRVNLE